MKDEGVCEEGLKGEGRAKEDRKILRGLKGPSIVALMNKLLNDAINEHRRTVPGPVCTSPVGQVSAGVHVAVSVTPTLRTLPSSSAAPWLLPIF